MSKNASDNQAPIFDHSPQQTIVILVGCICLYTICAHLQFDFAIVGIKANILLFITLAAAFAMAVKSQSHF